MLAPHKPLTDASLSLGHSLLGKQNPPCPLHASVVWAVSPALFTIPAMFFVCRKVNDGSVRNVQTI